MTDSSTSGLRLHRARVSVAKREAVVAALDRLVDEESMITVAAVARAAGVSREFIHSHDELHGAVKVAGDRQSAGQGSAAKQMTKLNEGRDADRSTLLRKVVGQAAEIAQLSARNNELETARARHLGDRLMALEDPPELGKQEALATIDRLQGENGRLERDLTESKRLNHILQDDLAAARYALADALREHLPMGVTAITKYPPRSDL